MWFDAGLCNTPGFQLFCVLYVFCIYFCIIQKIHRGRTDQGEKFHREVYTEPSWHAGWLASAVADEAPAAALAPTVHRLRTDAPSRNQMCGLHHIYAAVVS